MTSEPGRDRGRQGSEMPNHPDLTDHAGHDPSLIAAYAAGDATGEELNTAAALVAACAACGELHHDLRAIRAAMTEMPAPARPRDFRLTEEQAASLRPAGWRAIVSAVAGPRFRFAAPLGTAMAALGLAGLLLTGSGLSILPPGGVGTGAVNRDTISAAGGALAPEAAASPSVANAGGEAPQVAAQTAGPASSAAAIEGNGTASAAPTSINTLSSSPVPPPVPNGSPDTQGEGPATTAAPRAPAASGTAAAGDMAGGAGMTASPVPAGRTFSQNGGASSTGATSGLVPLAAWLLLVLGLVLGAARLIARRLI